MNVLIRVQFDDVPSLSFHRVLDLEFLPPPGMSMFFNPNFEGEVDDVTWWEEEYMESGCHIVVDLSHEYTTDDGTSIEGTVAWMEMHRFTAKQN